MLRDIFESSLELLSDGKVSGSRYLLAVSGGVDSMCMADLFVHCVPSSCLGIAHVNFSLRGEESDGDEDMVRRWAGAHSVEFHTIRFDTLKYAGEHSVSVEMAARELRYGWFGELLERRGYDFLSVAHNRNDRVETLFLNLLRGTGVRGLAGMKARSGHTVRPLLDATREEIEEYARLNSVPYRTDRTNLENDYARNKIRNIVFPAFRQINPSFLDTVSRDMKYFSEAWDVLEDDYRDTLRGLVTGDGGDIVVDSLKLKDMPHRRYRLYRILSEYGFNASTVDDIDAALSGQPGRTFSGRGFELVTGSGTLRIYPSVPPPETLTISVPGDIAFGNINLRIGFSALPPSFSPVPPAGTLYLDAAAVHFPLTCRTWREADRFRPFGMKKGTRKLGDFFTDLKMDRRERALQPVLCDAGGKILCLPGLRIDDRCRITDSTSDLVTVSVI